MFFNIKDDYKEEKLYFNIVSEIPKWLSITVEHSFQKTVNI